MNNRGFTMIEIMVIIIMLGISFVIFGNIFNQVTTTTEQQMEYCMEEYEDFDYCKYKLGFDYE